MLKKTLLAALLFCLCLLIHVYYSSLGLTYPLSDPHGFRQAQTAITTYYFIENGIKLDYWTPTLGAPWSIPMELPLFQAIITVFVQVTNIALDPAGRIISLILFYAMLPTMYGILRSLLVPKRHCFILLSFTLLCPIYLFWSRTFLIESLALTLTLLYFFLFIKSYQNKNKQIVLSIALLIGILAATVKITTFVLILLPTILYWLKMTGEKTKTLKLENIVKPFVLIGVPIMVGLLWIAYADSIKALNPIANGFLTSKDMTYWNYGTIDQKLSFSTWRGIVEHMKNSVIGMPLLFLLPIITFPFNPRYRMYGIISLAIFCLGPVLFTNLYYVHDYYYYANSIFLILAIGFSILGTLEKIKYLVPARVIVCTAFLLLLFSTYKKTYYSAQATPNYGLVEAGFAIQKNTKKEDVVLIYGHVWSPEIPYYAERKSIMDMWGLPLNDPKIKKSIQNTGKENITAMFIRFYDEPFIKERITYFNFDENPVFINPWGKLYIKKE